MLSSDDTRKMTQPITCQSHFVMLEAYGLVLRLQASIRAAFCQSTRQLLSQTGMLQLTIHTSYATQTCLMYFELVVAHCVSVCLCVTVLLLLKQQGASYLKHRTRL